jgi:hypothetical protein
VIPSLVLIPVILVAAAKTILGKCLKGLKFEAKKQNKETHPPKVIEAMMPPVMSHVVQLPQSPIRV